MKRGRQTVWAMMCMAGGVMTAPAQDEIFGDWQGTLQRPSGEEVPVAAQVIPDGADRYTVNLLHAFDQEDAPLAVLKSEAVGTRYTLQGDGWLGRLGQSRLVGRHQESGRFWMERVERPSPTLGAPPPEGAVVLLGPGMTDLSQTWKVAGSGDRAPGWAMVEDGTMQVVPRAGSLISRQEFGDAQIHVEFRIPLMTDESGQGRGNSGVYIQDRYEIQILDSYGLEGRDNECGGIYQLAAPRVNMTRPPMQWQTYDIDFTAPRIDSDGSAAANARVTVRHNGVLIHDDLELPQPTGSARSKGIIGRAGLALQDHGDPVAFRNIWVVDRSAP